MSETEEDMSSFSKQKSIFSGMGRVKQINHLREKWSPKPKSLLPDRSFVDAPPSSLSSKRQSRVKIPASDKKRHGRRWSQSVSASLPTVTTLDMERYLAINTWLEGNGINVALLNRSEVAKNETLNDHGLFDDMYCSLEVLERTLQSELSGLGIDGDYRAGTPRNEPQDSTDICTSTPAPIFDYLAVIGPDMLDVKMRNFLDHTESVFEATVAFAHPSESQYHAESLEHFCFPTGIKSSNASETDSAGLDEGEFFVFTISGGGTQGQSIQYAMCIKATVTVHSGIDYENDLKLPICYCIIAQIPFIPFFRSVLQNIFEHLRNDLKSSGDSLSLSSIVTDKHAVFIDDILQHLQLICLPEKGSSISVNVFPSPRSVLTLARTHNENGRDEKVSLLLQWALPSLLSRLSIDRVLQILSLMLLETKIIVVSDDISLLSSFTLGFVSLLHPLVWAGPVISVLPPSMHEYMEAPVPFVCGVNLLPPEFECPKGTCIFHVAEDRVQRHKEDERVSNSLQMPELENLTSDLTRFTKQMLGPVAGTFRDDMTPLSAHLVVNRVRRHIEHLISISTPTNEIYRDQPRITCPDASEKKFIDEFIRTQMFQKHHDDQFAPLYITHSNQQHLSLKVINDDIPTKSLSISTHHDDFKSAASMLFQIALAGVSTLPRSTSWSTETSRILDNEVEILSLDIEPSQVIDEPEPTSVTLSSLAATPTGIYPRF